MKKIVLALAVVFSVAMVSCSSKPAETATEGEQTEQGCDGQDCQQTEGEEAPKTEGEEAPKTEGEEASAQEGEAAPAADAAAPAADAQK